MKLRTSNFELRTFEPGLINADPDVPGFQFEV